jgi:putative endonuclease
MAGLDPAIHAPQTVMAAPGLDPGGWPGNPRYDAPMSGGWIYIMTNRPNGVLYTGVTSDIGRRAHEHREGLVPGFTKRYGLKRLVYMEFHERIADAIQRESNIKHWPRAWKVRLILDANPGWNDLYETLNQ